MLSLVKYVLLTYFSPWHTNPANVARAVFWQIDRHAGRRLHEVLVSMARPPDLAEAADCL